MKKVREKPVDTALAPENVASATECTGLMPALPRDEAQDEADAVLYGIHRARKERDPSKG